MIIYDYGIDRKDIVLFMDNASTHCSAYTLYNIRKTNVRILYKTTASPALNVIELIFGDLKKYLRK